MQLALFTDYTNYPGLIICHSESRLLTKQNQEDAGENSLLNSLQNSYKNITWPWMLSDIKLHFNDSTEY